MSQIFLIDFENVQPKALDRLAPGTARIKVFLGQHQTKLMLDLVRALQPFGSAAEYIQIQGSGPDAVDFHIAFYIGRLAAEQPDATFTIVSKDRGFDPLVRHLATLGIECRRLPEIPETGEARTGTHAAAKSPAAKPSTPKPAPKPAAQKASAQKPAAQKPAAAKQPAKKAKTTKAAKTPASAVSARKPGKPADADTLPVADVVTRLKRSSLPARLVTLRSSVKTWFDLDDAAADAVIERLRESGRIAVTGTRVAYALD